MDAISITYICLLTFAQKRKRRKNVIYQTVNGKTVNFCYFFFVYNEMYVISGKSSQGLRVAHTGQGMWKTKTPQ